MAREHHATVSLGTQWSQLHKVLVVKHTSNVSMIMIRIDKVAERPYMLHLRQRVWKWSMLGVEFQWDCRATLADGSPMCIVRRAVWSARLKANDMSF